MSRKMPETYEEALEAIEALEKENWLLQQEIKAIEYKAEYFDALIDKSLLTNFSDTAKKLGMKQDELINRLLGIKYVYRDAKGTLKPNSQCVPRLFELKKVDRTDVQILITPQGRETFRLLFGR